MNQASDCCTGDSQLFKLLVQKPHVPSLLPSSSQYGRTSEERPARLSLLLVTLGLLCVGALLISYSVAAGTRDGLLALGWELRRLLSFFLFSGCQVSFEAECPPYSRRLQHDQPDGFCFQLATWLWSPSLYVAQAGLRLVANLLPSSPDQGLETKL